LVAPPSSRLCAEGAVADIGELCSCRMQGGVGLCPSLGIIEQGVLIDILNRLDGCSNKRKWREV